MAKNLINMKSISKVFFSDDVETHALSDITLTVNEGEYVSISGPSGCGKSTLLSVLGLLDVGTKGQYELSTYSVNSLSNRQRAEIRNREIGFVFQSFNLISDMSVWENVLLPLRYRTDKSRADIETLVKTALDQVGLTHRKNHFPSQLSGGQQQRVAIARAIAGRPSLILADEPTGNLDSKNAKIVMDLLSALHKQGATICMVTHDPKYAMSTERSIHMIDGKIVADYMNKAAGTSFVDTLEVPYVEGAREEVL